MLIELGKKAKAASRIMARLGQDKKNEALLKVADALIANAADIIKGNDIDMENAKANGMSEALLDRLKLTEGRLMDMAEGIRQVVSLEDPVGEVISMKERPNGLMIGQKRVPMGVIGIIYESRPNVTVDAFALCFKTGNAVILRGGSDCIHSNIALIAVMKKALVEAGVTPDAVSLIEDTDREVARQFMKMNQYVDLLIPRGGAGLIRTVVENATIPVIETGTGNCHIYVDKQADLSMAADIIYNAKTSRPSVCNACESLVIHRDVAKAALPMIKARLDEKNVIIHGDEETAKNIPDVIAANEEDYGREYLGYEISVKVVGDIDEAIEHIMKYSSGHSECIVTDSYFAQKKFTEEVDAAAVYVNASTRFTDGGEFGFGAEIGISTQKLHARGPLGLSELTSVKYVVKGDGQVR